MIYHCGCKISIAGTCSQLLCEVGEVPRGKSVAEEIDAGSIAATQLIKLRMASYRPFHPPFNYRRVNVPGDRHGDIMVHPDTELVFETAITRFEPQLWITARGTNDFYPYAL
jgi:hypothetical protein